MKTFRGLCLAFLFVQWAHAQDFDLHFSHALPDTITFYAVEWVDADNDGSLDVLAFGKNAADEFVCLLLKNDSFGGLEVAGALKTELKDATWLITDVDGDNSMDIILSGMSDTSPILSQFLNKGGFVFEASRLYDVHATVLKVADLNQDGKREMLISGYNDHHPFLNILEWQHDEWKIVHDSINIAAIDIEFFDFDADSDVDFLVTGLDDANKSISRAFYNQRGCYFTDEDLLPTGSGSSVVADLNHDGAFDILLGGEDNAGPHRVLALLNDRGGDFSVQNTLLEAAHVKLFAADVSSDGLVDVNVLGYAESGDTINLIKSSGEVLLPHKQLVTQSWGDGDRDGDLDLLQLIRTSKGDSLRVLENTTWPENAAPLAPSGLVIAEIMNRMFISWEKPTDDRTARNSLTYDVAIQSAGRSVMPADFDVLNGRRLNVSHGNNGTADYLLLRDVGTADVGVSIQAVDNSFHAGPGSICKGSGGGGRGLCSEVETVNLDLCKNERVTLSSSSGTRWFSFEHGFLADTSSLVFDFQRPDTVFSLTRHADCAQIVVYVLAPGKDVTRVVEANEHMCEGEVSQFGVEPDWQSVEWSSASRGFLSSEDTITYVARETDTLKVRVSDASGCVIQRNTAINIGRPVIEGDDTYQILKGESVRMRVSGGTTYEWSPQTGLDKTTSSDPLASPLQTTEYTVTASDSSGCRSSLRIIVLVEETAFVPNLFTPNHDGKNDLLKIYGLGQVSSFTFTIYNREGNRVYHTENVSDAVTHGWNGTVGGVEQPGGVYYWSVTGQTLAGKALQLNGRKSGSIVLLR